ncbi:F0F1 ATP synthase subunit B' [Euhalothece natronophila Z-M001]|uniref:ATP synthase subunit b' n=1 Tax=Euhalothece natronophila Z-M001 TaxID=522448 RepID=A0A5B8NQ32_9CHRO|nr:F0F1 ATP synthase subunit B' [Euhalothece natronophila Z-M001]
MTNWMILLAAEAVETTKEGGLFDFDATLPLMAVQFLVLVALLNVLFYKPLTRVLDERDDYVRKNLNQAKENAKKSEELAQKFEEQLKDARRESQEIIAKAQAEAQEEASKNIAQAQQEVQAQREKATAEIEAQKREALQSLESQVDTLSHQVLDKLVGRDLVKR